MHPRVRTLSTVIAVASLAAVTLAGLPAAAAPASSTAAPPRVSLATPPLAQVRESVDYLRRQFHIGQAEALRRLVVQRDMPAVTSWLAATHPDTYAGAWLDQEHGGAMVVLDTQPARLDNDLARLPSSLGIRTVQARFSAKRLQALAATIRSHTGTTATVLRDDAANQLVVTPVARVGVTAAAVQAARTDPAVAQATDEGAVRFLPAPHVTSTNECDPLSCTPPKSSGCDRTNCTPPLPAGDNLDLWSSTSSSHTPEGRCTNGFNLHGSNGWVYSSTAGHCLAGAANDTSNNGHWVGQWAAGYNSTGYPYDYSIDPFITSPINYATYWLPGGTAHNLVFSGSNRAFPITGYYAVGSISQGWTACSSGTMTGTTCGTVQSPSVAGGGIAMNVCQHHGDSGAPLFSQIDNTAYGLSIYDDTTDDSCPSGYRSYYTPISYVLGDSAAGVTIYLNES